MASKILERLVADQIFSYLADNDLIFQEQHKFSQQRSTVTNLLQCDAVIAEFLNKDKACDIITIDFSRAFDKVPHRALIENFSAFGICGNVRKWIGDFFSGRTQYVSYLDAQSASADVTSGIIQGFVIGPQMFKMYVNDLSACVKSCKIWLFADDGKFVGGASREG